ncbi:uncharacterized protein LOC123304854 [Chrysoperla carnea]|uniref:uncharacterized protein LOC123304854 n=1 Tax=Chrysoperla carnea TaxID=189513 RepID=UPI001D0676D7|nr:uncharacterized protein LOC123304854 [Chrysoperla carnea]
MKKIILKRSRKNTDLPSHRSPSPPLKIINDGTSTSTEHDNSANRIDEDSHPSCVSISPSEESNDWIAVTCFNNRVFAGRLENKENSKNLKTFFKHKETLVQNKIMEYLSLHTSIKISLGLKCDFIIKKGDMEVIDNFHFVLKLVHYDQASDFNTWYYDSLTNLDTRLEEFQQRGSNAALDKIVCLELNIAKFDPMKGGSYIALPKKIIDKKACVNIKNNDDFCFAYCLIAHFKQVDVNPHIVAKYLPDFNNCCIFDDFNPLNNNNQNLHQIYDFRGVDFPVKLKDIPKIEKNNDFSVNVYGLSDSNLVNGPLYFTKEKKEKHINLLMISDDTKFHYCLIRNLSRLCSSQKSNHGKAKIFCDRCLQHFNERQKYNDHLELCENINNVKIIFPSEKESKLKFKNYNRKLAVPFVIYSDFECFLPKAREDNNNSNTTYFQHHVAYYVAIQVVCSYDVRKNSYYSYTGRDAAKWFIDKLKEILDEIEIIYKTIEPIHMTLEDEISFHSSTACHICEKPFLEGQVKVRDHCHLNSTTVNPLSNYRGAAHEGCNLNFTLPNFVPVIFHNGSRYDFNLFIRELGYDDGEIRAIPINSERYISFSKKMNSLYVRFIDSCRFMQSSLDSLVKNLDDNQFHILENEFGEAHPHLGLLKQKGIFPYDYITGWDKLEENSLPDKKQFYNQLTDSDISDEEYEHAKNVWEKFNIKTLGEYADLYLKCYVLLLTCVFENFRKVCYSTYGLEAIYYYTIPGLTFDAMLKVTQVELDLITDINILNFVENSIRGGLTIAVKRYAESNNPYMQNYNPNLPESYIVYLDANNLYGLAMSQPLPLCDFKFLSPQEIQDFNIQTDVNGEYGYLLEVDINYPHDLHDNNLDKY